MIDKFLINITNAKPHSFWIAVCVLLFTISGCQNDIPEEVVNDGTIRFATEEVKETKASINSPTDFKDGDAFGVFGAYHPNDPTQEQVLFDNTKVTHSGGSWNYDNVKQWEKGNIYRFRAFFPYENQTGNPSLSITNALDAYDGYELTFVIKDVVDQQEDLLVSNLVARDQTGTKLDLRPVEFTFSHILTKINIKVKLDTAKMNHDYGKGNWTVREFYVNLKGMNTKGICSSGTWKNQSLINETGYVKYFQEQKGGSGYFNTADPMIIWGKVDDKDDGLLMIPQGNLPNIRLGIGLYIDYKDRDDNYKQKQTFVDNITPLPANTPWENGKQITYVATFNPLLGLKFLAPKVEPWAISKNSNSVIIR